MPLPVLQNNSAAVERSTALAIAYAAAVASAAAAASQATLLQPLPMQLLQRQTRGSCARPLLCCGGGGRRRCVPALFLSLLFRQSNLRSSCTNAPPAL